MSNTPFGPILDPNWTLLGHILTPFGGHNRGQAEVLRPEDAYYGICRGSMATPAWPEAMLLLYLSSSTIRSGLFQTSNMGSQTGPDPEIQTLRSSDPQILRS